MPNHCYNVLKITGPKDELERFKKFAVGYNPWHNEGDKEEILCCANFVPPPPEVIKDYSNLGYNWCVKHWSTKWGCYNTDVYWCKMYNGKEYLQYQYDSAWCPPDLVFLAMSKKFPKLYFKNHGREAGMQYQTHFWVKDGVVRKDIEIPYSGHYGG